MPIGPPRFGFDVQETPNRNPYEPPQANLTQPTAKDANLIELEITLGRTALILWSYMWRSTLASVVAGLILDLTVGVVLGQIASAISSNVVGISIQIAILRSVLEKRFERFSIQLTSDKLAVTWQEALAVWWCFTWRSLVGMLLLGAVVVPIALGGALGLAGVFGLFAVPAVSVAVFRTVLRKEYMSFRINLVTSSAAARLDRMYGRGSSKRGTSDRAE